MACVSVLILSHNKIGDDGARAIAHALRGCEVVSVLDLSGNGIQDAYNLLQGLLRLA